MRDYTGDMSYYEEQLINHGVSKEEFDINNYVGLTARELQGLVNQVIAIKESAR